MKLKRLLRWGAVSLGAVVLVMLLLAGGVWCALRASLAQLNGQQVAPGLAAAVRIERDALGVPTIYATNRLDATRALGFLHGQERFFQMDLNRRAGGGELSALFGSKALSRDRSARVHRPRMHAQQSLTLASPEERALVQAYSEGVNAGLKALGARPPEYLALRAAPVPWQPEDVYLVAYAMFANLHDVDGDGDYRESVLRKALTPAACHFFNASDVRWSAALDDSLPLAPVLPGPQDFTASEIMPAALAGTPVSEADVALAKESALESDGFVGSNNWAVDGKRSGTGSAIVANDMHLNLSVPNTWYRVRLRYFDSDLGEQDVIGVTLPGTPAVVSGSNRHVAWSNTASDLDVTDLVELEWDPGNPRRYRVGSEWRELDQNTEIIVVRGGTNVSFAIDQTLWGPVVTRGNHQYALACTIHEPQAINMGLLNVERARDAQAALAVANQSGTPVNNFIVGDRAGRIGYSLLGQLPKRVGFDGSIPVSWANGMSGWRGWIPAKEYPRVLDPSDGVLWTANNRTLGIPEYSVLHGISDNGARARQIRDGLRAMAHPTEESLWTIYRDDRALFLEPWQKLLLSVLSVQAPANVAGQDAKRFVESWGGRAAAQSQGYRLVRAFREQTLELLFEPVNQHLGSVDKHIRHANEEAAWAMLNAKPAHLLNPKFKSYEGLLEAAFDRVLADLNKRGIPLADATWGARNRLQIRHPISLAVPWLSRWLDMTDVAVSGDSHMPKVHKPGFGASERMIVSPGHEENGLYNMPAGQSGHFLSPFYRTEMEAWLKVEPRPLLPGPTKYELELRPPRT